VPGAASRRTPRGPPPAVAGGGFEARRGAARRSGSSSGVFLRSSNGRAKRDRRATRWRINGAVHTRISLAHRSGAGIHQAGHGTGTCSHPSKRGERGVARHHAAGSSRISQGSLIITQPARHASPRPRSSPRSRHFVDTQQPRHTSPRASIHPSQPPRIHAHTPIHTRLRTC